MLFILFTNYNTELVINQHSDLSQVNKLLSLSFFMKYFAYFKQVCQSLLRITFQINRFLNRISIF